MIRKAKMTIIKHANSGDEVRLDVKGARNDHVFTESYTCWGYDETGIANAKAVANFRGWQIEEQEE